LSGTNGGTSSSIEKRHIEATPGTCGGKPRVAGHRVRVQDIVLWTEQGQSADEIVSHIASISLADVHAALAYYYDHRDEIDDDLRRELTLAVESKARAGISLADRLRGMDGQSPPVSP
jgi:uncharacterized protein (DUF433 family)